MIDTNTQEMFWSKVAKGDRASGMTKTHCIKGHPLEAGNLLKRVNGRRNCAKCQAIRQAAYRAAKKGENHVGN